MRMYEAKGGRSDTASLVRLATLSPMHPFRRHSHMIKSRERLSPFTALLQQYILLLFVFLFFVSGEYVDGSNAVTVLQSLENDALACLGLLAGDLAGLCLDGDALF